MMRNILVPLALLIQQVAWANPALPSADSVRSSHPDLAAHIESMPPIRNRAGMWFFPGSELATPQAQALLLERFVKKTDSDAVRQALVHRIDQETHPFSWEQIQSESSPQLRASMLHWTKRSSSQGAVDTLMQALDDPAPHVRSEAARLAGYKALNTSLTDALVKALADRSPEGRN